MDETYLYQRIAEDIRQAIISGQLIPGGKLPPIRQLTQKWNCTPGTVQKAYLELAQQGLVLSQAGKGTHVIARPPQAQVQAGLSLRSARLVHHAETFLLESLTAGYSLDDIQQAVDMAKDRWRSIQHTGQMHLNPREIRFSGSHDLMVVWMAGHMPEIVAGTSLQLNFTGSLGGLMALAENQADVAGCHLWDSESQTYNMAYIRKLFPGQAMTVIRLATRRLGLITAPGNPKSIQNLSDLVKPDVRFINRQNGSGTRVWLDTAMKDQGIDTTRIVGYSDEKMTHSDIAMAIAESKADAGIGLESAAVTFNLAFIPFTEEPYDLVTYSNQADQEPMKTLFRWIASGGAKQASSVLRGYDFLHSGELFTLD